MTGSTESHPHYEGSPLYGYDAADVRNFYAGRQAAHVGSFLLDLVKPGMSVLDCGCGPGTITLDLAEAVAPGKATGIDIEAAMIEQAKGIATERGIGNAVFQVDDITNLSFADDTFDVVFSSAVLEHLPDPVVALREVRRVLKPGGTAAIISTDWGDPLISPESADISRFFQIFEAGFNRYGGSLNRGRHLRLMMREAGFNVTEFEASYGNGTTPEMARVTVEGYIAWMENIPVFDEAIARGEVDRATLNQMAQNMRKWAEHPDVFVATGRCRAIGIK